MKNFYFLLCLVFISLNSTAQIVNIPDANFKAKLLEADTTNSIASNNSVSFLPMKIDANSNGEIEVSEALLVRMLYVNNSNIGSLIGIDSFPNLRELSCTNNLITSLDLNNLTFLRRLGCSHNLLSSLNCQNIENRMEILDCSYNNLTSFSLPNFYQFQDQGDQDMYANCSHNQLNVIDIVDHEQLSFLDLSYNNLTTLSFSNLEIYGNLILSYNPLTNVNLNTTYVGSQTPDYPYGGFACEYTNITEIDIPFNAINSSVSNNPNLTHIKIKNGILDVDSFYELDENGEETGNIISFGLSFADNPQLVSICVDQAEFDYYNGIAPSTVQVIQNCSLGISDNVKGIFSIYPNPSFGNVNIEVSNNQQINKTTIHNILGQTIMFFGNSSVLDISSLTNGTYFITVETDKGIATQKVIKL